MRGLASTTEHPMEIHGSPEVQLKSMEVHGLNHKKTQKTTPAEKHIHCLIVACRMSRRAVVRQVRHSGLQKDVLNLYRSMLRAAREKNSSTYSAVRAQFRASACSVRRRDFGKVEHMIRKGQKDLKLLQMPSFKGLQVVESTATDFVSSKKVPPPSDK